MSIDTYLTSSIARERIGDLVIVSQPKFVINEGEPCRELLTRLSKSGRFQVEYEPSTYDFSWAFSAKSEIVELLKEYRQIEKEQGIGSTDQRSMDARFKYMDAWLRTGITFLCDTYSRQTGYDPLEVFGETGSIMSFDVGQSAQEGLNNAIEHGSKFCEKAEVRVKFLGGERGALVFIEDPGEGFNLQPLSQQEIGSIYKAAHVITGGTPKARGMGLTVYAQTKCAN